MMLRVSGGTTTPNPTEKCRRQVPISMEGVIFRSNVMAVQGLGVSHIFYNLFQLQGVAWLAVLSAWAGSGSHGKLSRKTRGREASFATSVSLWAKEHSKLRASTGGVDAEARDHFVAVIHLRKC